MGTSNWQNISYCVELIRRLNPKSVLDIGAGFGRWGILCREFLEIWDEGNYSGNWKIKIDAVEVFDGYIKPYHNYFYDNVYITEASEFIDNTVEVYDLIICGDVIEHFEKTAGLRLIKKLLKRCKYLMINIPIGKNWEQGKINDNEYEEHKSTWYIRDFEEFKNYRIKMFRDYLSRKFGVVLLSDGKIDLKSGYKEKYGKHFFKKKTLENRLKMGSIVEKIKKKK